MDLGVLEPQALNFNFTQDEISPLMLSVTKANSKSLGIVQMVVANPTLNLNYKDAHGFNALHYAAQYGYPPIFKFLYRYGWRYQWAKDSKIMPLHLACKHKNTEIVKFILENIDDPMINRQRDNGLTPLMYTCISGDKDILKLLIEKGADPYLKTPK